MAATSPHGRRWLYGPLPDLLLGCGGLYVLVFGTVLLAAGPELRGIQPAIVLPLVALLAGSPHYGATLLRVYERRRDRRSYVIFSLWASLAVAAAFVAGLWVPAVGVFLLTLYLTWSPWHYTGQNYGVGVMFLRRSGVDLQGSDKRWVYASFLLSYALVFVIMHAGDGTTDGWAPGYDTSVIRFQPLGIPLDVVWILAPALGTAYLVALAVAATRLLRRAPARALAPTALLALTQALWFSLPFALRFAGFRSARLEALDWDFRTHYFLWIAAGHHLQYLWVTSYYARRSSGWTGYPAWYAKVFAAGGGIWMLPALLFGPLGLGPLAMDQGLALLIASAVNLHHFVLDGAIWKLRGRIAEVLIRSGTDALEEPRSLVAAGVRRAVWAACAFGAFLFAFQVVQKELARAGAEGGDLQRARAAWNRLAWFGLDEAAGRLALGRGLLERSELPAASAEIERSLRLAPRPEVYDALAESQARAGDWRAAAETCERGLETFPDHLPLLIHGALAWNRAGQPQSALRLIERAAELAPANPAVREERDRTRAAAGRAAPAVF